MRWYLQSSWCSIQLCSHCAYSLALVSFALFATHGAARVPPAFELMWLSHYLSHTAQRLVQLPYGIQVSHGFGRLHGKVDWI